MKPIEGWKWAVTVNLLVPVLLMASLIFMVARVEERHRLRSKEHGAIESKIDSLRTEVRQMELSRPH